jgi:hypothetical protein
MKHEAFIKFSDLRLQDYIIDLKWNIKARTFPIEKHTIGDSLNLRTENHQNCYPESKIFKNIFDEKIQDYTPNEQSSKIGFESINSEIKNVNNSLNSSSINIDNILNSLQSSNMFTNTVVNNISNNQTTQNNTTNQNQFDNNINQENIDLEKKTENNITQNFTEILNQKIEESNQYTIQQLEEIENNIKNVFPSETYITVQKFIEEKRELKASQNQYKSEIESKIKDTKKFLEDFLNK